MKKKIIIPSFLDEADILSVFNLSSAASQKCGVCQECEFTCDLYCESCGEFCESCDTCQSSCEKSCQSVCEKSCQICNTCETTCELNCEGQHSHSYTRHTYTPHTETQHLKKSYCSCGDYISKYENHTYSNITYYENGYIKHTCGLCGYKGIISVSPPFKWTVPKTTGARCQLTAPEWNAFITLLNQIYYGKRGSNPNPYLSTVTTNSRITAIKINEALNVLRQLSATPAISDITAATATEISNQSVRSTCILTAKLFNDMVAAINSLR